MRPFSRRTRWLLIALAGAAAMLAGALPVLVSAGRPPTPGVTVQAGGVDRSGPGAAAPPGDDAAAGTTAPPSSRSSAPPSTGSVPVSTAGSATAGSAPGGAPPPCLARNLAMNAGTDRVTYRPGNHILVRVSVTNQGTKPCFVTDRGSGSSAAACDPQVLLQLYDDADDYNALLGPYSAPCGPDPTVLTPGAGTAAQVDIPFTPPRDCGPNPGAPACQLRAGSWTVVVNWLTGGSSAGDAGMSAELVFFCPPDACSPAPSAQTGSSTTSTTAGSSTTTSTTAAGATSTTAPSTHKSSTTTTSAATATTSTTTRRASRRAGG